MNLPHTVAVDPGIAWIKDETPAIDVPPDTETRPAPEARWSDNARRSGVCGAVTPDVVPIGHAPHVPLGFCPGTAIPLAPTTTTMRPPDSSAR